MKGIHKKTGICECCGLEAKLDIHHIDKNRDNNAPDNLIKLCRYCHKVADGYDSRLPVSWEDVKQQYLGCFPRAK